MNRQTNSTVVEFAENGKEVKRIEQASEKEIVAPTLRQDIMAWQAERTSTTTNDNDLPRLPPRRPDAHKEDFA